MERTAHSGAVRVANVGDVDDVDWMTFRTCLELTVPPFTLRFAHPVGRVKGQRYLHAPWA